jgi:hypothetical protein
MNLSALLGKKLKDDDVLDVLEDYEIEEVVYDFDRLHENIEDAYWAPARPSGFLLRFNQHQVLDTVFCYIVANEGFAPISPSIIGVPIYQTFDEAEQACRTSGLRYSTSQATKRAEHPKWWLHIKAMGHYQFENGLLFRVTLSMPKP